MEACRDNGQEELGKQCLELVRKNPYLDADWEKRLQHIFYPAVSGQKTKPRTRGARRPPEDPKPDDGTVFHYCSVQIEGVRRSYAYLTGGLPLKVGDWVELPFGKDDAPRKGQVKAIMDCTRTVAPWPPEQTKTVIKHMLRRRANRLQKLPHRTWSSILRRQREWLNSRKRSKSRKKQKALLFPNRAQSPKRRKFPHSPWSPLRPMNRIRGRSRPRPQRNL